LFEPIPHPIRCVTPELGPLLPPRKVSRFQLEGCAMTGCAVDLDRKAEGGERIMVMSVTYIGSGI
ncbi:hypothetical protein ACW9HQ_44085, partial [Nocardia gipuzkoensis]